MRHIKWVSLLAALIVMAIVPLGANARISGCTAPCMWETIDHSTFHPKPGQMITYTYTAHPTGIGQLTVFLKELSPQIVLVKSKTSPYRMIDGVVGWTRVRPKDPTTLRFTVRVKLTARPGSKLFWWVKTVAITGEDIRVANFHYPDHVAK